jgi:hypothetical protein
MRRLTDLSGKASSGANRRAYMQAYAKGVNRGNSKIKGPSLAQEKTLDLGSFTQGTPGVGSERSYGKGVGPGGQAPSKSLDAASFSMLPRHVDLIAATKQGPAPLPQDKPLSRVPGPAKIKSF